MLQGFISRKHWKKKRKITNMLVFIYTEKSRTSYHEIIKTNGHRLIYKKIIHLCTAVSTIKQKWVSTNERMLFKISMNRRHPKTNWGKKKIYKILRGVQFTIV